MRVERKVKKGTSPNETDDDVQWAQTGLDSEVSTNFLFNLIKHTTEEIRTDPLVCV